MPGGYIVIAGTRLWATSADGEDAQTTPNDLAALGEHMAQCTAPSARLVALHCRAGRLLGMITARLVTTMAALAALSSALLMWW